MSKICEVTKMNNLLVLAIIIPIITGMFMVFIRENIKLQRGLALLAHALLVGIALWLMHEIRLDGIQVLNLGGWQAPFGISLVADMFAALLVLTTALVAALVLVYAFSSIGEEREANFFYPLWLFLIAGINASFLTGDIFNLFVAFEVMLVASYVLITLGSTRVQLRESVKYIVINMLASSLFLVAVALLYSMLGTLNMGHLSVRVAEVGQTGLLTAVAFLFLIVFALKAALLLFFWLPTSYSAPPTAVAAVFAALLTKVGIYAIIRVFSLIFYHEPGITHLVIGILAGLTMVLGAMGAVAYNNIRKIITYNVVIGVGFILAGFASFSLAGLSGAIYYLIHDITIKALLFLLAGTIIQLTGTAKIGDISGLIRMYPALGWMFFLTAMALAGIPPLSGFIGKLLITEGTFTAQLYWLGGLGLFTSLLVLYSLMKIFMKVFWGYTNFTEDMEKGDSRGLLVPMAALLAVSVGIGLGAEYLAPYVDLAARTLLEPDLYIQAVLK